MVLQLLVTIYKVLGSPEYQSRQGVRHSSASPRCSRQGGVSHKQSGQLFGLQNTRRFPISLVSFYHKYSHVQPYRRVYFAIGVTVKMCNASVEILLKVQTLLGSLQLFLPIKIWNSSLLAKQGTTSEIRKEADRFTAGSQNTKLRRLWGMLWSTQMTQQVERRNTRLWGQHVPVRGQWAEIRQAHDCMKQFWRQWLEPGFGELDITINFQP